MRIFGKIICSQQAKFATLTFFSDLLSINRSKNVEKYTSCLIKEFVLHSAQNVSVRDRTGDLLRVIYLFRKKIRFTQI